MPRFDRRTRLAADLYINDHTRRGFASAQRGYQGYVSGLSRTAGLASNAMGAAVSGNAMFAAAAGGAAMLSFAASSTRAFVEMEQKWAEVTTLMPDLTKKATDEMLGDVRAFTRQTGFELTDSINATYQAISAGIDPDKSTSFLKVAGKAARAGVADLTTSVDALTSALNAYSEESDQATNYSDAMFTAIRLGKTTFQELAPVMGPVLPLAASMGTEFNEVTAAVAALTAMGNPTSIAVTQVRAALVALSKDTQARSMFESVTGMSYQEFQAGGGTIQEALKMIVDEAERTGVSVPEAFGRIEGANAALALSSEKGSDTFKRAMSDTEGATEEAARKIEETTGQMVNELSAAWGDMTTSVGGFITNLGVHAADVLGIVDLHARQVASRVEQAIRDIEETGTTRASWADRPDTVF